MKSKLNQKELEYHKHQLKEIIESLEDLNALYSQQIQEDPYFQGAMADAYRMMMQELYKEHQKIIQFYQTLNKNLNEFYLDYEDEKQDINNRVDVL